MICESELHVVFPTTNAYRLRNMFEQYHPMKWQSDFTVTHKFAVNSFLCPNISSFNPMSTFLLLFIPSTFISPFSTVIFIRGFPIQCSPIGYELNSEMCRYLFSFMLACSSICRSCVLHAWKRLSVTIFFTLVFIKICGSKFNIC